MSGAKEILSEALGKVSDGFRTENAMSIEDVISIMEPAFAAVGKRHRNSRRENILVVRLDDIGDNVLMTGFLRELRRSFPKISENHTAFEHPF